MKPKTIVEMSIDDALENAAITVEGTFGRAHTYASENADIYRAQDHALAEAAERVRALKGKYTQSATEQSITGAVLVSVRRRGSSTGPVIGCTLRTEDGVVVELVRLYRTPE